MALVIFFVPDPAKGVAEMVRVVSLGGTVAAYAWDMAGGGFPLQPVQAELLAMGFAPVRPPRSDASKIDALQNLWTDAGLDSVETRKIEVQRRFADFEDFWATAMLGSTIGPTVATMVASDRDQLKTRVRARLPADGAGRITYGAWANAVAYPNRHNGGWKPPFQRASPMHSAYFNSLKLLCSSLMKHNIASGSVQPQAARDGSRLLFH